MKSAAPVGRRTNFLQKKIGKFLLKEFAQARFAGQVEIPSTE